MQNTHKRANTADHDDLAASQGRSTRGPQKTEEQRGVAGRDGGGGVHRIVQRDGTLHLPLTDAEWHAWGRRVFGGRSIGGR